MPEQGTFEDAFPFPKVGYIGDFLGWVVYTKF